MTIARPNVNDPWRRHKLAAIPLLVIVLVVSLYRSLSRSEMPTANAPALPTVNISTGSHLPTPANTPAKCDWSRWPRIDLKEIVASDPFVPWLSSDSEPASVVAKTNAISSANANSTTEGNSITTVDEPAAILNEKIQALYQDDTGSAAIVDSRIIRPGDALDGGFEVVGITSEGIIVKLQ